MTEEERRDAERDPDEEERVNESQEDPPPPKITFKDDSVELSESDPDSTDDESSRERKSSPNANGG